MLYAGTFSIVAADPSTGEVGCAVQSKYFAIGAVTPWVRAGVGAVATQAMGVVARNGRRTLDALATDVDPASAIDHANADVLPAMRRAFVEAAGGLPERMMSALEAGQAAGGDRRGQQAAALVVEQL